MTRKSVQRHVENLTFLSDWSKVRLPWKAGRSCRLKALTVSELAELD